METKINLQKFNDETSSGVDKSNDDVQSTEPNSNDDVQNQEPLLKYSDDDVNKLINRKFAEWEKAKAKEMEEAKKLAELSGVQKAEYERDLFKEKFEKMEREISLSKMRDETRRILSGDGISIDDSLINMLINESAEKTNENINCFKTAFNEAVQKKVTETLKSGNLKNGNQSSISKEDILKIKDPFLRQQKIIENMNLFKK